MSDTDPNILRHDEDTQRRKADAAIDDARDQAIIDALKADYHNTPAFILVPDPGPPKSCLAPYEPREGPAREFPYGHQPMRRIPVYRR